jgi:hypothetical protein
MRYSAIGYLRVRDTRGQRAASNVFVKKDYITLKILSQGLIIPILSGFVGPPPVARHGSMKLSGASD